jgi:hypothetical protein
MSEYMHASRYLSIRLHKNINVYQINIHMHRCRYIIMNASIHLHKYESTVIYTNTFELLYLCVLSKLFRSLYITSIYIYIYIYIYICFLFQGMSAENQLKLFKTIIQFHPGLLQEGKGSGLGLFISKGKR